MLGIDERALRAVWTVFLFGLLIAVIYFIRDTLLIFALAIFFAYILFPIVGFIERFVPKRRNLALTVVYILLVGFLVLIGFEVIPTVVQQATSLLGKLPSLLSGKASSFPLPRFLDPVRSEVMRTINSQLGSLQAHIVPLLQDVGKRVLSSLGAILPAVLIPILAFFFLKDAAVIRKALVGAVDAAQDKTLLERILSDVHFVIRSYMRALVLLSVVAFIFWVCFLAIMGYPYEVLIAGIAGILEFIPVIGPVSALIIILIVYTVSSSTSILWIVVFWAAYRVFADYVLNPYLMSSGVELHPLLVLFGVFAGESLAGVPGMFFSIPVIAILRVIYNNLRSAYVTKQLTAKNLPVPEVRVVTPEQIPREIRPHIVQPGQST